MTTNFIDPKTVNNLPRELVKTTEVGGGYARPSGEPFIGLRINDGPVYVLSVASALEFAENIALSACFLVEGNEQDISNNTSPTDSFPVTWPAASSKH